MLSILVEGTEFSSAWPERLCAGGCAVTLDDLYSWAQAALPVAAGDVYFTHNGKKLSDNTPVSNGVIRVVPRLVGGKGGFGSMLRAIGAQIEKTTNREACRDLSGRRLRDINEEKRLKNWISKKADREREAKERKQKRLEKLRSEPRIEFTDKKYEEERTKLTEVVHDAVEQGFQASTSNPGSSGAVKKPTRKGFMFEEEEFSDDSSENSSEEESSNPKNKTHSDEESEEESSYQKEKTHSDEESEEESSNQKDKAHSDESSEEESSNQKDKTHSDESSKRKLEADTDKKSPVKKAKADYSSDSSDESLSDSCDRK